VKAFFILLIVFGCLVSTASAQSSEKLTITAKLEQGDVYSITGFIRDGKQNPVPNAVVSITTWSGTINTSSDQNGAYGYELPSPPLGGKFNVNIKAQKDGYLTGYTNTAFFVNAKPELNGTQSLGATFKIVPAAKIREDPIALKILQNIEQNKQQESERLKKLQEMNDRQKFIEAQREIANQNLLNDLGVWFEQFDPFNPRNAFRSFASQMDATVQDIYWAQYNFTETKTREGLVALQAVLDSGGTEHDARKAFYEKAATPRDELLKVNNEFNANYGIHNRDDSD
jgi:hypothetical protein